METKVLYPKIKALMAFYGDSQKELADYLDLSRQALQKRFNGSVDWQLNEIQKLMKRYHCKFEELIND